MGAPPAARTRAGPLALAYKAFFAFAPSLAGGLEDGGGRAARRRRGGRSHQFLSLRSGFAMNAVELVDLPLVGRILMCVNGSVSRVDADAELREDGGAELGEDGDGEGAAGPPTVRVVFDELLVYRSTTLAEWREDIVASRVAGGGGGGGGAPLLRLPLPRPVGTLETTYMDARVRVSRGEKGGVFVAARLPDACAELESE